MRTRISSLRVVLREALTVQSYKETIETLRRLMEMVWTVQKEYGAAYKKNPNLGSGTSNGLRSEVLLGHLLKALQDDLRKQKQMLNRTHQHTPVTEGTLHSSMDPNVELVEIVGDLQDLNKRIGRLSQWSLWLEDPSTDEAIRAIGEHVRAALQAAAAAEPAISKITGKTGM